MRKTILVLIIVIVAVFLFWSFFGEKSQNISGNTDIVFFYGRECPHCLVVEDFLTKNKISEKINFEMAEVFHNNNNRKIYLEKYRLCGITNEKEMGVPMLWAEGKCYIGQEEVISFFKNKMQNSEQEPVNSEQ